MKKTFVITMVVLLASVFALSRLGHSQPAVELRLHEKPTDDPALVAGYVHTYHLDKLQYRVANPGVQLKLRAGNVPEKLEGVQLGTERFAVHLIACDRETRSCAFRVNGHATGSLSDAKDRANSAMISNQYALHVDDIQFDFCDHRRFCDSHFQAYDVVNVSIVRGGG